MSETPMETPAQMSETPMETPAPTDEPAAVPAGDGPESQEAGEKEENPALERRATPVLQTEETENKTLGKSWEESL